MTQPTNKGPIITLKLDVTKIIKDALFRGKNGVYLDIALFEKPGDYSDGYAVQSISKERRQAGERGPILGNFTIMDKTPRQSPPTRPAPTQRTTPPPAAQNPDLASDDISF